MLGRGPSGGGADSAQVCDSKTLNGFPTTPAAAASAPPCPRKGTAAFSSLGVPLLGKRGLKLFLVLVPVLDWKPHTNEVSPVCGGLKHRNCCASSTIKA